MGMFDRFIAPCPRCGGEVEWQSKAGECLLRSYTRDDCPARIAADIDGKSAVCHGCGKVLGFQTLVIIQINDVGG